ncbi:MAG: DUF4126 domain-containing protein [Bdellovibrionales bacterium]|nr:DUF4126 domain-containing protein [Bdellovibrionales bacterium]
MGSVESITQIISLSLGVAWASGLNLYATILVLGILGATGETSLPLGLEILSHPAVITVAAILFIVEFVADKIPAVDSLWDSFHTFIRIPAGALLAAATVVNLDPGVVFAAGLIGGTIAAGTHATKAGTRVMVNASPEPVSNWTLSLGEDFAVIIGLWTALHHPVIFLILLALFIGLMVWLLPRIWGLVKKAFLKLRSFFSRARTPQEPTL